MNQPTNPTDPQPSIPTSIPLLPTPPSLPPNAGVGETLDTLLKRPAALVHGLCSAEPSRAWLFLALVAGAAFSLYGLLVGSFSGGPQFLAAAVKVSAGALLSALICFPSLYIFACLTGAEVSLRGLAGVLFAILTLTGLLLLGFAPVAWVFSQSTDSVAFIGAMHLIFWLIGTCFGMRLLEHMTKVLRVTDRTHLNVWAAIFVLVSLQMTTALRPIIGTADTLLPTEKRFFLSYWVENVFSATVPPPTR